MPLILVLPITASAAEKFRGEVVGHGLLGTGVAALSEQQPGTRARVVRGEVRR